MIRLLGREMSSTGEGSDEKKKKIKALMKSLLEEDNACYIVISCKQPSEEGKMEVEMNYEGDPDLVAYLLENAQNFVDLEE